MRWEYKTVRFQTSAGLSTSVNLDEAELERHLANAGADGWELSDTITLMDRGWTKFCILIFKRPTA
jgi:hypothetical protein